MRAIHHLNRRSSIHRVAGFLLTLCCWTVTGCDALQKKHENPVMTAAPNRINPQDGDALLAEDEGRYREKEVDGSEILQIKRELARKNPWNDWKDDSAMFNSQIAATVNGAPILNGEVLDNYTLYLQTARDKMREAWTTTPVTAANEQQLPTPETYEELRYRIIAANINQFIQSKLLVEYLKSGLKAEQIKMMNGHIDDQFVTEIDKLKKQFNVTNKTELELALNKNGTTLQNVKDNFALKRLGEECIGIKSDKPKPIERPDLVKYYQKHTELFNFPTRVKWEQIQVSYVLPNASAPDKGAARRKIEEAVAELKKKEPFDKVARKYSDGPTARDGGERDWLEKGNLADKKLEQILFELPVGKLSPIHEGPNAFSVIRVTEKQIEGRQPFREVQDEVRKKMEEEQNIVRYMKFMKKMYANAVIETSYSLQQFPDE